MALLNRDQAPSEQIRMVDARYAAFATSVTNIICMVENQQQVVAAAVRAFGLSGSPVYSLGILRSAGSALTLIGLGATLTATDGGVTLHQAFSLTLGATNLLQAGDMICVQSGGANTASATSVFTVAVKKLQDVQTYFNTSL